METNQLLLTRIESLAVDVAAKQRKLAAQRKEIARLQYELDESRLDVKSALAHIRETEEASHEDAALTFNGTILPSDTVTYGEGTGYSYDASALERDQILAEVRTLMSMETNKLNKIRAIRSLTASCSDGPVGLLEAKEFVEANTVGDVRSSRADLPRAQPTVEAGTILWQTEGKCPPCS